MISSSVRPPSQATPPVAEQAPERFVPDGQQPLDPRVRSILESITDAFFAVDRSWRFTYLNRHAETLLGRTDLVGKHLWEEYAPAVGTEFYHAYHRAFANNEAVTFEERYPPDDRWYEVRAFPSPQGLSVYFRDVTQRRRAEEALRQSEQQFRAMFELAGVGKGMSDPFTRRFLRVNRRLCEITGYTADELLGMTFDDITHPDDRAADLGGFARFVRGEAADYTVEKRYVRKDGSLAWVHVTITLLRDAAGRPLHTMGVIQDVTERHRAEARWRDSAAQLRALSRRLIEVQEEERRHLARELHDEVGQALTGLKLSLEIAERLPPGEQRTALGEAKRSVQDLIAWMREMSLDLRPSLLDDQGLLPALRSHVRRYEAQTGVQVFFHDAALEGRLAAAVETAAYRIVQEALTNVARHSGASEATLQVRQEQSRLCIEVIDSGVGFDPSAVERAAASSGLSGMRERAMLLGGRLLIESKPGDGTRVSADLPLHRGAEGTNI